MLKSNTYLLLLLHPGCSVRICLVWGIPALVAREVRARSYEAGCGSLAQPWKERRASHLTLSSSSDGPKLCDFTTRPDHLTPSDCFATITHCVAFSCPIVPALDPADRGEQRGSRRAFSRSFQHASPYHHLLHRRHGRLPGGRPLRRPVRHIQRAVSWRPRPQRALC